MRTALPILAAAVLAGALGLYAGQRWGGLSGTGAPGLGQAAPLIELPDLAGRTHRLDPADGRARLINYWASWCPPCVEELPLLDAYARTQGPNGIQVVGIALDDAEPVRAFLARRPVAYLSLLEPPGTSDSSVTLGNTRKVLPFSVLIGEDGRIRRLRVGAFKGADDLRDWAAAE
jgi:thiol-disulfide isomerase/thioredoxin